MRQTTPVAVAAAIAAIVRREPSLPCLVQAFAHRVDRAAGRARGAGAGRDPEVGVAVGLVRVPALAQGAALEAALAREQVAELELEPGERALTSTLLWCWQVATGSRRDVSPWETNF